MTTVTSQATDRLTSRRRTLHTRGLQVFTAFLVSCVLLLVMSWIVVFDPRLALTAAPLKDYYCVAAYGVPVKNYID